MSEFIVISFVVCSLHRTGGAGLSQGRSEAECISALTGSFHEKATSVNEIFCASFWGIAQGGFALLRGEPLFLRRGGNPPAPAFPFGETGKGK